MLKVDKKYCSECGKRTTHNYTGSKGYFEDFGLLRGIMAISSLGLTETLCKDKYWQCSKCGDIRKD